MLSMNITIQEHVELKDMTTMRVGGNARFFVYARSMEDLSKIARWIKQNDIPFFVLGGGSNTLVPDEGFAGLVIKMEIMGVSFDDFGDSAQAVVFAGESWSAFVENAVARKFWGVENLALIPGSVGGAFVQNIGAYGMEIRESVLWIEAFDIRTGEIRKYANDECNFGYRESLFKSNKNLIVVRGALSLSRKPNRRIDYEDIKYSLQEKNIELPNLKDIYDAVVCVRTNKMPQYPLGTSGSFFKNPTVTEIEFKKIINIFPNMKSYPLSNGKIKIPAAFLLDKIGGWKGIRHGNVGSYDKQALVIVNYGNAKTKEIILFVSAIRKDIFEKTNINLEEEVVTMKISE